ncbi:MAG: hypothetical protein ACFB10_04480 [Salibacteraceae bacterium]
MKEKQSFRVGLLLTVLLSTALLAWHYGELLPQLNRVYLGSSGDGIKNYYTLLYHVRYDSTYSHFEGMNYPYGEQVVFTDNQPLLANTLRWFSNNVTDVSGYGVGAINGAILVSIILCALLLYLLCVRLKLPPWYAALIAVGLALFSPQVHRMSGHYALSYGFVIPLIWLLYHRFFEQPKYLRSLAIGATVWLLAGFHFYYFAIGAFLLSLLLAIRWLHQPGWKSLMSTAGHFALQVLLPFVLLQLWFVFTDSVTDRPSSPYGFLVFRATWKTSFLPLFYPYGKWLQGFFNMEWINWEGIAYVGLVVTVMTLVLSILALWWLLQRQWSRVLAPSGNPFLDQSILAAALLLFFSFGVPFNWGLEHWIDGTGPLKQFRGIGRFSWIFFYVANLLAFYWLYHWSVRLQARQPNWKWIVVLPLLVLFGEGWLFSGRTNYGTHRIEALESRELPADHWSNTVSPDQYQAILPLPYYHTGSENLWIDAQGDILKQTLIASQQTGLPLMGVMMSRTSLSQTFNLLSLVLDPVEQLAVLEDLPNEKPLLLWVDKQQIERFPRQQQLLQFATPLWEGDNVVLMHLAVSDLKNARLRTLQQRDRIHSISRPFFEEGWSSTGQNEAFFYASFDDRPSAKAFTGEGAYEGQSQVYNTVFSGQLAPGIPGPYVFSCWVYLREDGHPAQTFGFEQLSTDGEYIDYVSGKLGDHLVALYGDWGLVEFPFELKDHQAKLNFFFLKNAYNKFPVWMDEVMIRHAEVNVFRDHGGLLWWNNRPYPKLTN